MHRSQRRRFLIAVTTIAAAPFDAAAQQTTRIARVGYLSPNLASAPVWQAAFLRGLRDLGYVEGRNVSIAYRDAAGDVDRLPGLAAELVALKVDIIVAAGTIAALAARRATETVPIVVPVAGDPVASGLVGNLARPDGNVTGLSLLGAELIGKRLELLAHAVPGVRRVAVLWQPGAFGDTTGEVGAKEAEAAARALKVALHFAAARELGDLEAAFATIVRARADALTVQPSGMFISQRRLLVELAARHRLPAVYQSRESVVDGGLMSYGPSFSDLFRRAAVYVDKILKGAKPGDLPVEQPTKFELVINLSTAKALGLALPASLLGRADELVR